MPAIAPEDREAHALCSVERVDHLLDDIGRQRIGLGRSVEREGEHILVLIDQKFGGGSGHRLFYASPLAVSWASISSVCSPRAGGLRVTDCAASLMRKTGPKVWVFTPLGSSICCTQPIWATCGSCRTSG